ncbi:hypothetical protein AA15973_1950 [Komagataeibacter sucrofermentans DSM 15973]|nr:hypothetical protein AA15973_1950 [Komagataeibacter sucrofermentans DSM 15973]
MPVNEAGASGWLLGAWMGMARTGPSARACAPNMIPPSAVAASSSPRENHRMAAGGLTIDGARGEGTGRDINRPLDEEVA